jgi:hypothetical protein
MCWLGADSGNRNEAESWLGYCERSCSEVKTGFQKLMSETDFRKQALEWHPVREAMTHGLDPLEKLAFIAYFASIHCEALLQMLSFTHEEAYHAGCGTS